MAKLMRQPIATAQVLRHIPHDGAVYALAVVNLVRREQEPPQLR